MAADLLDKQIAGHQSFPVLLIYSKQFHNRLLVVVDCCLQILKFSEGYHKKRVVITRKLYVPPEITKSEKFDVSTYFIYELCEVRERRALEFPG